MNSDRFVKVFDVLDSGFKDWSFPASGLLFVAIGILIAAAPAIVRATGIPFLDLLDLQSRLQRFFRYAILAFAILWAVFAFSGTYPEYARHRSLAEQGACRIVEGPVEHFVPMPSSGHGTESFSVAGVPFRYSDFAATDGFNHTTFRGGPVTAHSYVRVCYDPSDNVILRLQIRDFKGEPRDYSSSPATFLRQLGIPGMPGDRPGIELPWYGMLIVPFFFLDLIAIQALFLPYLRMFFRIKTTPVPDCVIPSRFEPGKKTKLRNSMICWDREDDAIWLRPRGLNVIQIPMVVARLNAGADGRSIVATEIRFSSGAVLLFMLLLWTGYQLLSRMPPSTDTPPQFVLLGFGAFAAVACVLNVWIIRSRMDRLVQDALSEIGGMRATCPVTPTVPPSGACSRLS